VRPALSKDLRSLFALYQGMNSLMPQPLTHFSRNKVRGEAALKPEGYGLQSQVRIFL
jgi:hypothetical protein